MIGIISFIAFTAIVAIFAYMSTRSTDEITSDGYFLGLINNTTLARWLTAFYFGYFLLMPFYTRMEKTKPVPERITGGH